MKKIFFVLLITILLLTSLTFFVKGGKTDPFYFQTHRDTVVGGPFESSNSLSRFALTESMILDNDFAFNEERRKQATPDLVYYKGKFFTIFTPGVSFITAPFYSWGLQYGMPQLSSYLSMGLFGILNVFLIVLLARKLGASFYAAILGGLIYFFATNALTYSLTYTQHTLSVTFIVLALLNAVGKRNIINNFLLGALFGAGLLVDIPNGVMMFPIGLYVLYKHFNLVKIEEALKLKLKLSLVGLLLGIIPLLLVFGSYNKVLTDSYTVIGQLIGRVDYLGDGQIKEVAVSSPTDVKPLVNAPYATRPLLSGAYTLLISDERSWIYYSPIVFLGILGLFVAYKNSDTKGFTALVSAVILIDIVSYTMFGDPWGGWSYGPRYLIPAAALFCAGVGVAVQKFKANPLFLLIFLSILIYSISINVLGALTTNAIPPKVEAQNLAVPIPYTYQYNLQLVDQNNSFSIFYNFLANRYLSLREYWYLLTTFITVIALLPFLLLLRQTKFTLPKFNFKRP